MTNYNEFNFVEITDLAGIYCFTNKKNGKKYVGKTNNLRHRLRRSYPSEIRNPALKTYFLDALRKHSLDSFSLEIVESYTYDQLDFFLNTKGLEHRERMSIISKFLCDREAKYIRDMGTLDRTMGYNRCAYSMDNSGKKRTPEQCKRNGDLKRGTKWTEEQKARLKEARSGEKHWAYGKKMKRESVLKGAETRRGMKHTLQARKKMSESRMKPVHQIDLSTGEIIRTFRSVKDAHHFFYPNKKKSNIGGVIKGERKSFKGFGWKWADKEELNEPLS